MKQIYILYCLIYLYFLNNSLKFNSRFPTQLKKELNYTWKSHLHLYLVKLIINYWKKELISTEKYLKTEFIISPHIYSLIIIQ